MTSSQSNQDRWRAGSWNMIGWRSSIAGCALLSLAALIPGAAAADDPLMAKILPTTPLILKDGRIARVSVHTIPFPRDAAALASKAEQELLDFTRRIATDCFLTAQVVGHVDKAETTGRDTVDIHRLARARADAIQGTLTQNGLPAESIASVWDWQFMVRDARATLWVFRLAAGEDCEDKALKAGQVADAGSEKAPAVENGSAAKAERDVVEASAKDDAKAPSPEVPPASTVTRPLPAPAPKVAKNTVTTPVVKPALAPSAADAAPVAPPKPKAAKPTQLAAVSGTGQAPDQDGRVTITENGALEIIFATNSSYFPQGAGDRLRAFLKSLENGGNHKLRISTSVDPDDSVNGAASAEDAARYNRWLAERRFDRVKAWLMKNAKDRDIEIESILLENDESRRVLIEPNPLS